MLSQLKKELPLHLKDIAVKLLIPPIVFLVGVVMVILIMATAPGDDWFCMGTLLALIFTVAVNIIIGFSYHSEFMLALSMGRTRKEFLLTYFFRQLLIQAVGYLMVLLLYRAESALYSVLYPDSQNEAAFTFLTAWWMILLAIPGAALLHMFLGAMYSQFGKKASAVFYVLWLGLCILGPRLIPSENHTDILSQMMAPVYRSIVSVPGSVWIAIFLCAAAAMAGSVIYLGRKQTVA